jgi:hypothetical protein
MTPPLSSVANGDRPMTKIGLRWTRFERPIEIALAM